MAAPRGLRAAGRRLWSDLAGDDATGAHRVLLVEACRIVDRLDKLDAILRGTDKAWMQVRVNADGDEVTVVVDRALAEARQQALALKQVSAELRQYGEHAGQNEQGGNVLDQLAARRAARLADAAGS